VHVVCVCTWLLRYSTVTYACALLRPLSLPTLDGAISFCCLPHKHLPETPQNPSLNNHKILLRSYTEGSQITISINNTLLTPLLTTLCLTGSTAVTRPSLLDFERESYIPSLSLLDDEQYHSPTNAIMSHAESASYPVLSAKGASSTAGNTFVGGEVRSFRFPRKASFTDNVTDSPTALDSSQHHNNSY
jgi:hypothetical protein